MGWKKTFKNSDGSYDTFDWSIGTEVGARATGLFAVLLGISLFCAAAPILILFIYPWPGSRKGDLQSFILAPIFTLAWILDLQFGVFNWFFWHPFPETYMAVTTINLTISFMCIAFYYFEDYLNEIVHEEGMLLVFYLLCGILLYFTHPMMYDLTAYLFTITKVPIWQ